jgi:hypothetical protein
MPFHLALKLVLCIGHFVKKGLFTGGFTQWLIVSRGVFMEMNKKVFIGLLGVFLAFNLALTGCNDGTSGGGDPPVIPGTPPMNTIEEAFANMLKANFIVSGSNATVVTAITKMSNWGQTNSAYQITSANGSSIEYWLPSSFGTVKVMSGGSVIISGGAVLMTGPDAGVVWGTPTGDTTRISGGNMGVRSITSGSNASVKYPFTVSFPSGSDAQVIKGNFELKLVAP